MKYKTHCCKEVLESKHRHDFKRCKCGKSFIDGGNEYSRVGCDKGVKFPSIIKDKNEK